MTFYFNPLYNLEHRSGGEWYPRIDLYEDTRSFYLILELAGVKKEDLKIIIEDDRIIQIRGKRENPLKEEKNANHHSVEIMSGRFARDVALPQKIDTRRIRVRQFNGIFKLILKKKCPKKIKVITID